MSILRIDILLCSALPISFDVELSVLSASKSSLRSMSGYLSSIMLVSFCNLLSHRWQDFQDFALFAFFLFQYLVPHTYTCNLGIPRPAAVHVSRVEMTLLRM